VSGEALRGFGGGVVCSSGLAFEGVEGISFASVVGGFEVRYLRNAGSSGLQLRVSKSRGARGNGLVGGVLRSFKVGRDFTLRIGCRGRAQAECRVAKAVRLQGGDGGRVGKDGSGVVWLAQAVAQAAV